MQVMKNCFRRLTLAGVIVLLTVSGVSAQETPTYTNARVVSIDPARRTLVIRNSKGQKTSMVFDDLLVSTGGVKAGDQVIVTILGGPGRQRVSSISLARPVTVASATPRPALPVPAADKARIRDDFARQVGLISENARGVDGSWASFVTACKPRQPETRSGSRDWFGLWDGRVEADYTNGFCRDLFNQIVSAGEAVKKSMAAAESAVLGALEPGEIRDIRTLHNMNWDGWTLPAPARREP